MTTTVALCVAVVALSLTTVFFAVMWGHELQSMRNFLRPDVTTPPERPELHPEPDPTAPLRKISEEQEAALPFDESNPPTWKTYHGRDGKYRCDCHGRDIRREDDVLLWPRPDRGPGVYSRFCRQWMIEQQRRAR